MADKRHSQSSTIAHQRKTVYRNPRPGEVKSAQVTLVVASIPSRTRDQVTTLNYQRTQRIDILSEKKNQKKMGKMKENNKS